MDDEFKATYYVDDGYVTGDRPLHFAIDASELDVDASDAELSDLFRQSLRDAFADDCRPVSSDEEEFLRWAHEQQQKMREEEDQEDDNATA